MYQLWLSLSLPGYKLPVESNKRKPNGRVDNVAVTDGNENNRMSEAAATKAKNKKNRSRGAKSTSSTRATPSGSQQVINSINNSINAHGGSSSRGGQGVKSGGSNKRGGKAEILSTTGEVDGKLITHIVFNSHLDSICEMETKFVVVRCLSKSMHM